MLKLSHHTSVTNKQTDRRTDGQITIMPFDGKLCPKYLY